MRTLYYVKFLDWKGTRRTFPAGDSFERAREVLDYRRGQNVLRYDFDQEKKQKEQQANVWTFQDGADTWLSVTKDKRSHSKDEVSVERLVTFFRPRTAVLADVTADLVEEYKQWRRQQPTRYKKPPTNGTINRELACLRSILVLAHQSRKLRDQAGNILPRPIIRMLRETGERKRIASEAEYHAILAAMEKEDAKCVLTIMWEMGSRESETCRMRASCVNFARDVITFKETKTKERTVPMAPAVRAILQDWIARHPGREMLFCSRHHFYWYFKKAREKAGITDLWVHDFKRTFITRMLNRGVNYKIVMEMTGNTDIRVFHRAYNQPSMEDLRGLFRQASVNGVSTETFPLTPTGARGAISS